MQSLWNNAAAARCNDELALRAYTSRLLGREKSLVLYGGGNTSLKSGGVLYVKGSGADLARASEADFTPLHLDCVRRLLDGDALDAARMRQALDGCIVRQPAPAPSVETLMHAS
ncbi:MAG: class II aldolase/adducin family protein, partial [Burkholderiales bacterium]|nr:class II aldolase/adducin family protein [Burkholderiales bacterium]